MNLYLLEQDENNDYETYDSMVVCAPSKEVAVKIHPDGNNGWADAEGVWCSSPAGVTCTLIGKAVSSLEPGIVLASNRGA